MSRRQTRSACRRGETVGTLHGMRTQLAQHRSLANDRPRIGARATGQAAHARRRGRLYCSPPDRGSRPLTDLAFLEGAKLIRVDAVHPVEEFKRGLGFLFIDFAERESHVNQYPVADPYWRGLIFEQLNRNVASHSADFRLGDHPTGIDDFNYLSRYSKAHRHLSPRHSLWAARPA